MINKHLGYNVPSNRYLNVVIDGYKYHKLPIGQLYYAMYNLV